MAKKPTKGVFTRITNKAGQEFKYDETRTRKIRLNEKISIDSKNYTSLLYYVISRMDEYESERQCNVARFRSFDAVVSGYETDKEREQREKLRREAMLSDKPHELPTTKTTLVMERLEDMKTSIMAVLFPSHEFYRSDSPIPSDMDKANAFSRVLNQEAKVFKHYSELSKITMRALKYNLAGGIVEWSEAYGRTFSQNEGIPGTSIDTDNGNVNFEGNEITAFDVYNTGWDMSVDTEKVSRKGEYVWRVDRESLHSLRKRLLVDETVYGPEELKNMLKGLVHDTAKAKRSSLLKEQFDLYDEMPHIAALGTSCRYEDRGTYVYNGSTFRVEDPKNATGGVNWAAFEDRENGGLTSFGTAEVSEIWIKLNPKDFGLSKENTIETWYFEIVNDAYIIYGAKLGGGNAPLPIFLGTLGDTTHMVERSRGEYLLPYQVISERMLDQHNKAVNKALGGGWTFVRKGMVDVHKVAKSLTGIHEAKTANHDRALSNDIVQLGNTPVTENPMNEVAMLHDMARKASPTASGKVMTDLQRATQHQSETVRFENSRVVNDLALLMDDRMFFDMRLQIGENEFVNREQFFGGVDEQGQIIQYQREDMRGISLTISNGLMSIDRFAVMSHLETIINFAIQSGERNEFDMVRILNFYADKAGIATNLSTFKQTNPLQRVSDQMQQALAPLAENGQLEPLLAQLLQSLQQQGAENGQ